MSYSSQLRIEPGPRNQEQIHDGGRTRASELSFCSSTPTRIIDEADVCYKFGMSRT